MKDDLYLLRVYQNLIQYYQLGIKNLKAEVKNAKLLVAEPSSASNFTLIMISGYDTIHDELTSQY